eukprot:14646-Heterococcus_DN1.PRE.2
MYIDSSRQSKAYSADESDYPAKAYGDAYEGTYDHFDAWASDSEDEVEALIMLENCCDLDAFIKRSSVETVLQLLAVHYCYTYTALAAAAATTAAATACYSCTADAGTAATAAAAAAAAAAVLMTRRASTTACCSAAASQ